MTNVTTTVGKAVSSYTVAHEYDILDSNLQAVRQSNVTIFAQAVLHIGLNRKI
jgi:hypothetical protein